ncbi:class I SAM-dependent methyltransferase [Actinomadura sp. DC4]|uniref:class I SAM-dependent methyltransferase n=1 Tax=Actinomadura sp. DC4 TaxID=3055069 RepID=UPI0025B050DE|nr:class I SAM-dependent methyltransferase [Actinomadura sp. DC4]MDN3353624.1 methyltransferase domain-containing protein [Actinomadura sp. DC4]
MSDRTFTPAAGRFAPTRLYDPVVALTRERLWRALLVAYVAPRAGDVIVDVGCGTGSLALMLARVESRARVIGVDPDPDVLARARRKDGGAAVDWRAGMGDALPEIVGVGSAATAVSSLVLHQCPVAMKRAILASMYAVLRDGGRLAVADYGLQRTRRMRLAFRTVQVADGKEDTQPNADGILPELIAEAGFDDVREADVVSTVTGSISIYTGHRA